jgi:hypothetical protein
MKLIDLARTPAEKKAERARFDAPMASPDAPDYPWGLTVTLDGATLDKLGIKDLPEVGAEVEMMVMAKVVGANIDVNEKAERREVRLQITQMAIEAEDDGEDAKKPRRGDMDADKAYPSMKAKGGAAEKAA